MFGFFRKHHGRKFESIFFILTCWFLLACKNTRSVWCVSPDSLNVQKFVISWSFALEHVDCFCPIVLTWKSRPRPQRIPKAERGLDGCETGQKKIASKVQKASKGKVWQGMARQKYVEITVDQLEIMRTEDQIHRADWWQSVPRLKLQRRP